MVRQPEQRLKEIRPNIKDGDDDDDNMKRRR